MNLVLFFSGMFIPIVFVISMIIKEINKGKYINEVINKLHHTNISFSKEEENNFLDELKIYSTRQEMEIAYKTFLSLHTNVKA